MKLNESFDVDDKFKSVSGSISVSSIKTDRSVSKTPTISLQDSMGTEAVMDSSVGHSVSRSSSLSSHDSMSPSKNYLGRPPLTLSQSSIRSSKNRNTTKEVNRHKNMTRDAGYLLDAKETNEGWCKRLSNWIMDIPLDEWDGVVVDTTGHVSELHLSGRDLDGVFSQALCRLSGLRKLFLDNNKLTGQLPRYIKHLDKLEILDLSHNQFKGELPTEFAELKKLQYLSLSKNMFCGQFGNKIQRNLDLRHIDVSYNMFTEDDLNFLEYLEELCVFNMKNNSFCCKAIYLPTKIITLRHLTVCDFDSSCMKYSEEVGSFLETLCISGKAGKPFSHAFPITSLPSSS